MMRSQGYAEGLENSKKSWNVNLRSIVQAIATELSTSIAFYPSEKPRKPAYPHVTSFFLSNGDWNQSRERLMGRPQVDVFTNDGDGNTCGRIAGLITEKLGFDPQNHIFETWIPQNDWLSSSVSPPSLFDITVLIESGWEELGNDPDPGVRHRMSTFQILYK